jgi:3,4-dihydroxy 2-butanone 4-phosphate synthase/GTP cyclohydrolase II
MLYRNTIEGVEHVALVHGKIEPGKPTLVRMHQVDFAADLLGHVEARQNYIPAALKADRQHAARAWSSSCATPPARPRRTAVGRG